jgi:hypothetical protein
MEPTMQAARKDERKVDESLPDPRLNPMINPRLGKNLGRWANVYYTTPPEKREQAVLELVRELEGAKTPAPQPVPLAPAGEEKQGQAATTRTLGPKGPSSGALQQRFCGLCGSSLRKDETGETRAQRWWPSPQPHIAEARHDLGKPSEALPVATGTVGEKRQSRKHIVFVLFISAVIGAWCVGRIRLDPAPLTASKIVPISQPTGKQIQVKVESPDHSAGKMATAQPIRDSSPALSKPAAGKPIGCGNDHLENCAAGELYRRTMTLADGIDALFTDYDKRMTQLLRDATATGSSSLHQKQNRARQANYSAQVWERLQLASYASHERYAALKYRAELMRRTMVSRSARKMAVPYEHPQSCLEVHYIAQDLRRLAAKLPRPALTTTRASTGRAASPLP